MTALDITTAAPEVMDAIYAALTGDSDHMALALGVYDHVPEPEEIKADRNGGEPFPFENIAAISETWADTFDTGERQLTVQIDVWSRYHGRTEAQAIQASQIGLLNRKTQTSLALATLHLVSLRLDYNEVLEDPDGMTWHGVTRYMALVQATS